MPDFQKKMRIQYYDLDFNQIGDRLVEQDPELYKGPKEAHKGPLRIEVSLFTKDDINSFKAYLDMLVGDLPITEHKKKGRKSLNVLSSNYRDEFIKFCKENSDNHQLSMSLLREQGFRISSLEFLQELGLPIEVPTEEASESSKTSWLVRLIREAKNPLNNRYDPTILIGVIRNKVKVTGKIIYKSKIKVIIDGSIKGVYTLEDKASSIKVPIKYKVKFPYFLTLEERAKIRIEMGQLKADPDRKPSPLYKRWIWAIAKENESKELEFPRLDTIPNPYLKW